MRAVRGRRGAVRGSSVIRVLFVSLNESGRHMVTDCIARTVTQCMPHLIVLWRWCQVSGVLYSQCSLRFRYANFPPERI